MVVSTQSILGAVKYKLKSDDNHKASYLPDNIKAKKDLINSLSNVDEFREDRAPPQSSSTSHRTVIARCRSTPTISYETFVWTIFLAITAFAIVDRFTTHF